MNYLKSTLEYLGFSKEFIAKRFNFAFEKAKMAILAQNLEELKMISKDKNSMTDSNQNILHFAISNKRDKVAIYIIQNIQINLEEKNSDGDTALMLATFQNNMQLIELLVEKEVNINTRENQRSTPLIVAAANGFIKLVQYFIRKGANVNSQNFEGQNALHRACYYGQLEVVRYLINKGHLKPLKCDKKGSNCLHLAAEGLSIRCFRYLTKKVHDKETLFSMNQYKKTPYDILLEQFNLINQNKQRIITLQNVLQYLEDKTKPILITSDKKVHARPSTRTNVQENQSATKLIE